MQCILNNGFQLTTEMYNKASTYNLTKKNFNISVKGIKQLQSDENKQYLTNNCRYC